MRAAEATDPITWTGNLRAPARFDDGLTALLAEPDRVLLNVGPGEPGEDSALSLVTALGRLWLAGHRLDAGRLFAGQERRRVPLPSYPFARIRYWIEPDRAIRSEAPKLVLVKEKPAQEPAIPLRTGAAAQTLHPRPDLATPFVAPRGEVEEKVAELWRRVLGVAEIGVDDSFLDLGGDSLLATRMLTLLREELHADLPLEEIFAHPTVAGVINAMTELEATLEIA
jgi:acyl transferase domain-containing protein